jgi:hypothetical protein
MGSPGTMKAGHRADMALGRAIIDFEKWFPEPLVCRVLPFVVTVALVASAWVPK